MSATGIEALLARLFTDATLRRRFLGDPRAVAKEAGLDHAEAEALARIDRVGLEMAAESYRFKRDGSASKTSR